MFEWIQKTDEIILLWIQNNLRFPVLTPVMQVASILGNAGMVWLAIALFMIIAKRRRSVGLLMICSMLVSYLFNNLLLKNLVARPRPYTKIAELDLLLGKAIDASFPSGHTASSMAAAIVMLMLLPKRYSLPGLLLALLISFSRLYVGIHYPSDVAFGLVSGIVIGVGMVTIHRKKYEKMIGE